MKDDKIFEILREFDSKDFDYYILGMEMFKKIPKHVVDEFDIDYKDVLNYFLKNIGIVLELFEDLGFECIKKDLNEGILVINSIVSRNSVIFKHMEIELSETQSLLTSKWKFFGVAKIEIDIVDKELLSGYLLGLMIIDSPVKYSYEITEDYLIVKAELEEK